MPSAGTCLVTGPYGFVGRNVVRRFAEDGFRVVGAGRLEPVDDVPVDSLLARFERLELPDPCLAELVAEERPDVVVHAAGPASVPFSMAEPVADFTGATGPWISLLDAVRLNSPDSRVLLVSSAGVYGNPVSLPVAEDAPIAPVSPYGFHRAVCESLGREYASVFGVRVAVARVFSAYGPGLRKQVVWDIAEKAASGDGVRLFGTGAEARDFVHVSDVAGALRTIAQRGDFAGEAYNVATGTETSIREVAERVVGCVAPGTPVEFDGATREGDPVAWRADVSKLARLGFTPTIPLEDGLAGVCEWYLSAGRSRA